MDAPDESRLGLIPHTVFALRLQGESGWRMGTRPVTPELLWETLQGEGLPFEEVIALNEHKVVSELAESCIAEMAGRRGWIYDWFAKTWRTPDEPIASLPGSPRRSRLSISIKCIYLNKFFAIFSTPEREIEVVGNHFYYDPLPSLVLLLKRLLAGGYGHAQHYETWGLWFEFHVLPGGHPDEVRAIIRYKDWYQDYFWIDMACNRLELIKEIQRFFFELSTHPDFIHHYLVDIDDDDFDKACALAEEIYLKKVASGEIDEFDMEAEDALTREIIRTTIPIPEKRKPYLRKYLKMLSDLEIPKGWL